jgi:hypothetical protein
MDWLEEELQRALSRKEAPAGFAAGVLARSRRRARMAAPRWIAAAAAVVVMCGAGYGYRWRQGTAAKEQVMFAMKIAGSKVNHIQAQVQGLGAGQ